MQWERGPSQRVGRACRRPEGRGWGRAKGCTPHQTSDKCGLPWCGSMTEIPSWGWHGAGRLAEGSAREARRWGGGG